MPHKTPYVVFITLKIMQISFEAVGLSFCDKNHCDIIEIKKSTIEQCKLIHGEVGQKSKEVTNKLKSYNFLFSESC